jgi:CubicO group peptidase (beta-lactamase class C family)
MSESSHPQNFPIHGTVAPGFEDVREAFVRNFTDGYEMGASLAVEVQGERVVNLWGGYADADGTEPWQADTLVNVYSTTKGVAAAAFACLVQDGLIRYEDPVANHWPELRAAQRGLTVGQLLAHQGGLAGLRRELTVPDLLAWDQMINWLQEAEPLWEPGTAAGYHAITWGFLPGELCRRVSGASLGEILAQRVCRPLDADFHIGLDATHFDRVATVIGPNRARRRPPLSGGARKPRATGGFEMPPFYQIALENPVIRPFADVGTDSWRQAEIAAANGHGNGRSIARIYGALANAGNAGKAPWTTDTVALACQEEPVSGKDLVLGRHIRRGRGFFLNADDMYGPGTKSFGHSGAGGSLGFADPERALGFGYAMNQMQMGLDGDSRTTGLIAAVYNCLR